MCWLRRKRSENELAALALADSPSSRTPPMGSMDLDMVVPDTEAETVSSTKSIWDDALIEPEDAMQMLTCSVPPLRNDSSLNTPSGGLKPWNFEQSYFSRATPVPSRLVEVGRCAAVLPSGSSPAGLTRVAGDIACGIEFEEHGWLFATAGVSKQVRVYSLASCLRGGMSEGYAPGVPATQGPLRVHRMASKLSSLAWNPDHPGVVTVGDYDGVVNQIDLESGHLVIEADEHAGRRVWSVSHSLLRPHVVASGADDGRIVLWGGSGLHEVTARVTPPSNGASVTGVHLSPHNENLLAAACADSCAYLYDLRRLTAPIATLQGHSRPLSYVKFLDAHRVVTAATDGTLATFDFSPTADPDTGVASSPGVRRTHRFTGHHNYKNFVGLAVRPEDNLVACGSESDHAYAYSMSWEVPLVAHKFTGAGISRAPGAPPFCCAVAWQPATATPGCPPVLAAATSDGMVRMLALYKE